MRATLESVGRFALVTLAAVALSALGMASVHADIYSWTDRDGVVHFTNVRPRGNGAGKWRKVLVSRPERGSKASARRGACANCDTVPATDTSPERFHRYDPFILEASQLYRIPVPLIRAVIKTESDYDPHVVSNMNCKGLMQIHPKVEIDMGITGDVFDPRSNIMAGTRLLRWLANRVDGDIVLTIAGYHAGLGSVMKYGYTVPPFSSTRKYLKTVLERYYRYKADAARAAVK